MAARKAAPTRPALKGLQEPVGLGNGEQVAEHGCIILVSAGKDGALAVEAEDAVVTGPGDQV